MATEFGYLLNAMERAACESNPAKHNYHDKRIAVLGHVSAIEAERDRLRAELANLLAAIEAMRVAGGAAEFQRAFDEAKVIAARKGEGEK